MMTRASLRANTKHTLKLVFADVVKDWISLNHFEFPAERFPAIDVRRELFDNALETFHRAVDHFELYFSERAGTKF